MAALRLEGPSFPGVPAAQAEQGNGAAGVLQLAQLPSEILVGKCLISRRGQADDSLAHKHHFLGRALPSLCDGDITTVNAADLQPAGCARANHTQAEDCTIAVSSACASCPVEVAVARLHQPGRRGPVRTVEVV